ncbi:MAG: DUF5031 domain-containing protein [Bacteroidales bacterium]|nr:DUF5031 domain-containing protein [Bacteroidales bacterium]
MKKNNIIKFIFFCILGITIVSCSNELDENNKNQNIKHIDAEDIPVSVKFNSKSLPNNLNCQLFVFWKNSNENDYMFKESIVIEESRDTIDFINKDLSDKLYRFLFVASPVLETEIEVVTDAGFFLSTTNTWEDMMIRATKDSISPENYYGILDKTGEQIMNDGTINGVLTRLVGQMAFDFFRTSPTNIAPIDIISGDVASVVDRIYEIEISYTSLTKGITFDNSKNIKNIVEFENPSIQKIQIELNGDFKVPFPNNNKYLDLIPTGEEGAVRIYGLCSLPTSSLTSVDMEMTVRYLDTTPTCDNNDNKIHTSNCFDKRELTLTIPGSSFTSNIQVKPNYYTVNKGGILFDRIIDLGLNGSLLISTDWE